MRLRITKPFDDPDYIFELKHDGFRAIAYIEGHACRLVSRNANQFESFQSLKESLSKLKDSLMGRSSVTNQAYGSSCRMYL
jgi:ATP-dependent DNA ligase